MIVIALGLVVIALVATWALRWRRGTDGLESKPAAQTKTPRTYWVTAAALIAFGIPTGFSIGIPFIVLGLALLVLAPFRDRPGIFWPTLAGIGGFFATFVLSAPLSCSSTASDGGPPSTTTCHNLVGLNYSGPANYNPSIMPAAAVALGAGLAIAALTFLVLHQASDRPGESSTGSAGP